MPIIGTDKLWRESAGVAAVPLAECFRTKPAVVDDLLQYTQDHFVFVKSRSPRDKPKDRKALSTLDVSTVQNIRKRSKRRAAKKKKALYVPPEWRARIAKLWALAGPRNSDSRKAMRAALEKKGYNYKRFNDWKNIWMVRGDDGFNWHGGQLSLDDIAVADYKEILDKRYQVDPDAEEPPKGISRKEATEILNRLARSCNIPP